MLLVSVFSFAALSAMAQNDRTKFELYGGYSYLSTETGLDGIDPAFNNRIGAHGFEGAVTVNVHRYVGIKGDITFNSHSKDFVDGLDHAHAQLQTTEFMGGLQFKDNQLGGSRFRPFAHVLAGVSHQNVSGNAFVTPPPTAFAFDQSTNNFAMAFGGGVDVRANDHFSIRLFQIDYNPVFYGGGNFGTFTVDSRAQHNIRLGVGIVIH
jgi:opacity protein-like surface antigen